MKKPSRAPLPDAAHAAQAVGHLDQRAHQAEQQNTGKAASAASFGKAS